MMSDGGKHRRKLPVGVDSFSKIRREGLCYVDKTGFLIELLRSWGEVNLFTRPRRFGKTLNMSMLQAFFEPGADAALFDGLKISEERELCERYQGKYPVVFLTLKGVSGRTFAEACEMLSVIVSGECKRLSFLMDSPDVLSSDKAVMDRLMNRGGDLTDLRSAPSLLLRMMRSHYARQVIFLVDEYDVPLDKANDGGYYEEMAGFLRIFLGEAFKTNFDLYFAVVTGCLRISKESIFTGVNNIKVDTITDRRYAEYFGFTDAEVRGLLEEYGLSGSYGSIRDWYDGYLFGNTEIYCPWDVLCHCDKLLQVPDARPEAYWDNTSSNQLVRQFIDAADATARDELERLIAGGTLEKRLVENLTYNDLGKKELLWSVLYQTGYLTLARDKNRNQGRNVRLVIPNREIREIFVEKIREWFAERLAPACRDVLYEKLWSGDADALREELRGILYDTVSYHDYHENYYHALLVGLFVDGNFRVRSNLETGLGRSDIVIEDDRGRRAAILEIKRSVNYDDLEGDCEKALRQIREKKYAQPYLRRNYKVTACGIAFAGKDCSVKMEMQKARYQESFP